MKLLVSHMIELNNGGTKGLGTAKLLCNADKITLLKEEKKNDSK